MKKKEQKNTLSLKLLGSFIVALFLTFGTSTSYAQVIETVNATAEDEFDEWDVDNDDYWTEDEFGTAFEDASLFGEWDADDDDFLTDDEFAEGLFVVYDVVDDDTWSKEEFTTWANALGRDFNYYIWDTNDDGVVDAGEFSEAVREAGIYTDYDSDRDGLYIEDEIRTAVFDTWDADDDDYLDYDEYEAYGYGLW